MNLLDETLQDQCSAIKNRMLLLQNDNPKGSIVFPAFNEEGYLLPTLESLTNINTQLPLEIIGINNASTDRTKEILEQCGVVVIDEKRKGVSYARNTGLEAAKGEVIFETDADTKVPPTWIDAHNKYYTNPNVVGVAGGINFEGIHYLYRLYRTGSICFRTFFKIFSEVPKCVGGANISYRKDSATKIGGFIPGSNLGEDVILFDRLLKSGVTKREISNRINVLTNGRRFSTFVQTKELILKRVARITEKSYYETHMLLNKDFEDIR